jgi:hypothetical protein
MLKSTLIIVGIAYLRKQRKNASTGERTYYLTVKLYPHT